MNKSMSTQRLTCVSVCVQVCVHNVDDTDYIKVRTKRLGQQQNISKINENMKTKNCNTHTHVHNYIKVLN